MRTWDVITAHEHTGSLRNVLNSIQQNGHTIFSVVHRVEHGEFHGCPWRHDCWDIVCYVDTLDKDDASRMTLAAGLRKRMADAAQIESLNGLTLNLATLVRRLVRKMHQCAPTDPIIPQAMDFLARNDLQGNVLRLEAQESKVDRTCAGGCMVKHG